MAVAADAVAEPLNEAAESPLVAPEVPQVTPAPAVASLNPHVVDEGRSCGLVHRPVRRCAVRGHPLRVCRAACSGRGRDHCDRIPDGGVPGRVCGVELVVVTGRRLKTGVDEAHRRSPEWRCHSGGEDRGRGVAVADDLVGEVQIIPVPVGRPADPHGGGGQRDQCRLEFRAAQHRALEARRDRLDGETNETGLGNAVDAREFTAENHIVGVAGDRPGRLGLAR